MIRCLFWNLNALDRVGTVAALCMERATDLLILAECKSGPHEVIAGLAAAGMPGFVHVPRPSGLEPPLRLLFRAESMSLVDDEDDLNGRFTIRRLVGSWPEVLLVAAHLPSQLYAPRETVRVSIGADLTAHVRAAEARAGHTRTVLVGDLNMAPSRPGSSVRRQFTAS